MPIAPEGPTVQLPLVRYAGEVGWTVLDREDAVSLRRGEAGLFLYPVLRQRLLDLNPGVVNEGNVDEIVRRLESVRLGIEGNAEILAWLRGARTVKVPAERRDRNVSLIDFENLARNTFHVTPEWQYTNGPHSHRADAIFLVNGVPVALVETKKQGKKGALEAGLKQLRVYHNETPELLVAPQVFDINELVNFFYGATWNLDRKAIYNWKDEEPGDFERKVKRFFDRQRFLRLLREWIVFFTRDDELHKIVLRQHQTRAVDRVAERAAAPDKRRGLVWHTQGSGKTFTMIQAAERILEAGRRAGDKPTVLLLVDRNELETQLFDNLAAYGLGAERATSRQRLRELLRADTRGLIVSMIHKFDKADADLSLRRNIVVLVDEAHRTTGGDLGNYLLGALPNATLIGFSGTPIDRTSHGEGTFKVFGVDDAPFGYLDKYSMRESIEDGTTLPLRYTLAPNDIRVPEELLEQEFLALKETEGLADIEELNRILDRAVNLRNFLKAGDRVAKVAAFVAEHFKTNVDPLGYKAFLVGVDREACALYKAALDRHLPADWSEVVYTRAHNDEPPISLHHRSDDAEKRVRKAFAKADALPKVLIVTEKLLTGYDAPILYCMYLDKPMRDHTLLQAIARVNRPYEGGDGRRKPAGFVLDFVGIFRKLEKALAFDSDEVESVIEDLEVLKERFANLMTRSAPEYLALCRGPRNDKVVERIIDAFADKARRDAFVDFFREIEDLHDILSPDAFLRPYLDDYRLLAELCGLVPDPQEPATLGLYDLSKKTASLVQERVEAHGFHQILPVVELNEAALEALKRDDPTPGKVLNLAKTLSQAVQAGQAEQPFLIPIGERVTRVLEGYDDRQITTTQALDQVSKLVQEYLDANKERAELGLDSGTFTVYQELKREDVATGLELARTLSASFLRQAHYRENPAALRSLKAELYKELLPAVGKERMVEIAERLLRLWRPEPS